MRLSSLLLLATFIPALSLAQEAETDTSGTTAPSSAPAPAPAMSKPAMSVPPKRAAHPAGLGGNYTVLEVDGIPIRRVEVQSLWQSLFEGREAPNFDTQDPKVKQNILTGLASEVVVINAAKKEGLDEDTTVLKKIELAKRQILVQEYIQRHLAMKTDEASLHNFYEKEVASLGKQQEVRVRHILVKTPEEAKKAYERIKGGEDFAKVASDMSIEKGSSAQGGEVGWVGRGYAVPEFVNAALPLKDGEVSKPVKTAFGWHVIQAEEHRARNVAPFEESKAQVAQKAQAAAMQELVQNLLQKSDIKYYSQSGERQPFNRTLPNENAAPAAGAR